MTSVRVSIKAMWRRQRKEKKHSIISRKEVKRKSSSLVITRRLVRKDMIDIYHQTLIQQLFVTNKTCNRDMERKDVTPMRSVRKCQARKNRLNVNIVGVCETKRASNGNFLSYTHKTINTHGEKKKKEKRVKVNTR